MDWVHLFTSFEGRISRQPFWLAWAIFIAVEFTIALATDEINSDRLSAILDLVLIYPQFAVCAKRGHDRNTPTWVIGLFFAFVAVIDLALLGGWIPTADLRETTSLSLLVALPLAVFVLVLLIDLGFRRGTSGPNRYGPDPLEAGAR